MMESHKGAMMVARGNKTRTLYVNSSCRSTIAIAKNTVSLNLWHYRLGYMSEKGMNVLHFNGKLHRLKEVDHSLCEGCVFGKQKWVNFSKARRGTKDQEARFDSYRHLGTFNHYIPGRLKLLCDFH